MTRAGGLGWRVKSPFYLTICFHIKEVKTSVKLPGGMTYNTAESSSEGGTSDVVGEADVEAAVEEEQSQPREGPPEPPFLQWPFVKAW